MAPICCNEQAVERCLNVMLHSGFEPHAAKVGALLGVNEHSLMILPLFLVSQASINLQREPQKKKEMQQNCGQTRKRFPSAMPYRL